MKTKLLIARVSLVVICFACILSIAGYWIWSLKLLEVFILVSILDLISGIIAFSMGRKDPFENWDKACSFMLCFCILGGFITLPIVAIINPRPDS